MNKMTKKVAGFLFVIVLMLLTSNDAISYYPNEVLVAGKKVNISELPQIINSSEVKSDISFPAPYFTAGMDKPNNEILNVSEQQGILNVINSSDGSVIRTVNLPGISDYDPGSFGIVAVSDFWWHSDYQRGKLYKLNPTNGAILAEISIPAFEVLGIAWDGSNLWGVAPNLRRLYRIDTTTGAYLETIFLDHINAPVDISWDGNNFWVCERDGNNFYKIDRKGKILNSYSLFTEEEFNFSGIAADLPNVWLANFWNGTISRYYVGSTSYVVDLGFRPNPDGYYFDNYGNTYPLGDYDYKYDDLVRMFGQDNVCWMLGTVCLVKPSADLWHFQANLSMNGGHCDGMASTSLRFFKDLDNQSSFQKDITKTYNLDKSNIRRHIAYYFVEQLTDPVKTYKENIRKTDPDELLNKLIFAMSGDAPNPTTLFIRQAGQGGHAITPYAVQYKGDDVYWVYVYDNNHPNDSYRYVVINTSTNSWYYNLGTTTWSGDTTTDSLGIVPISYYAQDPVCPWCKVTTTTELDTKTSDEQQIWYSGESHLLLTNTLNQQIGFIDDEFINEIPGAYESYVDNGLGLAQEPIYNLPVSDSYDILINGNNLSETETKSFSQFGPGYGVLIKDLVVFPTSQDFLSISNDGTGLTYKPNSSKELTFDFGIDSESNSNQFKISNADVGQNQELKININLIDSQLIFDNSLTDGGSYNLQIANVDFLGKKIFQNYDLVINGSDTHFISYGDLSNSNTVTLLIDHDSDGSIDETKLLENQLPMIYLPIISK